MSESARELVDRLLVCQHESWKHGQRVLVEALLSNNPALPPHAEEVLDLVYNEIFLRERGGEPVRLAEYLSRFPQFKPQLELQFEVHQALKPQELLSRTLPRVSRGTARTVVAAVTPVPGYEILDEIGRGSMGVVYRARQLSLRRIVALKMIQDDRGDARLMARFRAEAEAVARVQHPNIVQIFEVGEAQGRPYFSFELVEGQSLARRLAGKPQPFRESAQFIEVLARAMQVAHQRGIIHRDLKPANVLITSTGVPKITDFGLAKRLDDPAQNLTKIGEVVGTPHYMATEQAQGRTGDVGPATDVYALGAILYEMLTGRPPFTGKTPIEVVVRVGTEAVVPPSRLRRGVPRDLEAICLKCLEKNPLNRYPSAAALADDLRRYVEGRPAEVRDAGALEHGWMWGRRHPLGVALLTVVAVAGVGLAIISGIHAARLREEHNRVVAEQAKLLDQRDRTQAALKEAETQRDAATQARGEAEAQRDRAAQAEAEALRHLEESRRNQYALQLAQVAALAPRDPERATDLLEDAARCPIDLRDFTWGFLRRKCERPERTLAGHRRAILALGRSPNGKLLASAGGDHRTCIWELPAGKLLHTLAGHSGRVYAAAFAPDSKRLATASADHTIRIWDATTGKSLETLRDDRPVLALAYSPDGSALISAGEAGSVKVWDPANGKLRGTLPTHQGPIHHIAFSADGKLLATAGDNHTIRLWDLAAGQAKGTLRGHEGRVYAVAFLPGGVLASVGDDGKIILWDAASGVEKIRLTGHVGRVCCLAATPDGRNLATGATNSLFDHEPATGQIKIWDVASGQERATLTHPAGGVYALAFADAGRTLAVGSDRGELRLQEMPIAGEGRTLRKHADSVMAVAFSPDGRTLASGSLDKTIQLWDAESGDLRTSVRGHESGVLAIAFAADRKIAASAGADGQVKLWDAHNGRVQHTLRGHSEAVATLAFSPDSRTLATGSADKTVKLWDLARQQPRNVLEGHGDGVTAVAFAPDGKTLASVCSDGALRLWDSDIGTLRATVKAHADVCLTVAFSPEGESVVTGGADGTIKVWRAADLLAGGVARPRLTIRAHRGAVWSVAYSPDGKTLVSALSPGEADRLEHMGEVRAWDPATGQLRATLGRFPEGAAGIAFAPNRRTLAVAGLDRTVHLLEGAAPGPARLVERGGPIRGLALSPDGRTLVAAGGAEAPAASSAGADLLLLNAATGKEASPPREISEEIRSLTFSRDGETAAIGTARGEVTVLDAASLRPRRTPGKIAGPVLCLALSDDGQVVAAAGFDGTVKIWDARGNLLASVTHRGPVLALAFSPDGKTLASAGMDRRVRLWESAGGREIGELRGHVGPVRVLAFGPRGRMLASGAGSSDFLHHTHVGEIKLWNVTTRKPLATLTGHTRPVRSLGFADEGELLSGTDADAAGGAEVKVWDAVKFTEKRGFGQLDGSVLGLHLGSRSRPSALLGNGTVLRLVDLPGGKEAPLLRGKTRRISAAALSANGKHLLASVDRPPNVRPSAPGAVTIWDTTTGAVRGSLREPDGEVACAAFAPGGKLVALAGRQLKLLDATTLRVQRTFAGHEGGIAAIAFAPDGRSIATAGVDRRIKLWDVVSGSERSPFPEQGEWVCLGFSRDSQSLAAAEESGLIRFLDCATGRQLAKLQAPAGPVAGLGFSRDGASVFAGCADGTMRRWRLSDGVEISVLRGHQGAIRGFAIAADGNLAVSAGQDGAVRRWDLSEGKERPHLQEGPPVATIAISADGTTISWVGNSAVYVRSLSATKP